MTSHHHDNDGSGSRSLRIAAIFIVALTSFLGTLVATTVIAVQKWRIRRQRRTAVLSSTSAAPAGVETGGPMTTTSAAVVDKTDENAIDTDSAVKPVLRVLSAISTGIILGTSTLHLLPEAIDFMNEAVATDEAAGEEADPPFPYAPLIAILTAFAMYIFEKEIFAFLDYRNKQERKTADQAAMFVAAAHHDDNDQGTATTEPTAAATNEGVEGAATRRNNNNNQAAQSQQKEAWAVVYSHVVEMALSIHSVILGLTLGLITEFGTVRALTIAVAVDQFSDGVAVGATLCESKTLSTCHKAVLRIFFAWTCSLGIFIGVMIEARGGSGDSLAQGILASMSAGMLLLLAMTGMLPGLLQPFEKKKTTAVDDDPTTRPPTTDEPTMMEGLDAGDAGAENPDTGVQAEHDKQRSAVEQDVLAESMPFLWRISLYFCMLFGFAVMAVIAHYGG